MIHNNSGGITLEVSDSTESFTDLDEINRFLAPYGSRVWELEFSDAAADVLDALTQAAPADTAARAIMDHFLLSREQALDALAEAGRTPQVDGGGDLETYVSNFDYWYPQLYLVAPDVDYTRFDRFHVNATDDGSGVDEFMQVLHGGGVVVHQRKPDGAIVTVHLDCPTVTRGWLLTYDGTLPHIGSLSGAAVGTKVLQQVIGSPSWMMRYIDEQG